jgi:hypoxia up-regulated 1
MAAAVDLAGLTLLQLMSEPMAVSLNYGMFRRKEINETVRNLMFYDMGSRDTVVSIVAFQVIKTKERGFTETHPQAQILGVG